MISLAFKEGIEAMKREPGSAVLHRMIMERTGGRFVHVELWLEGSQDKALCYSSRTGGTSLQVVDLSDSAYWKVLPILDSPVDERDVKWYCCGASGKPYDSLGIIGIGWDAPNVHDECDRFCSEAAFEALQVAGNLFGGLGPRWMVAPSGSPKGGLGLYELTLPIAKEILGRQIQNG